MDNCPSVSVKFLVPLSPFVGLAAAMSFVLLVLFGVIANVELALLHYVPLSQGLFRSVLMLSLVGIAVVLPLQRIKISRAQASAALWVALLLAATVAAFIIQVYRFDYSSAFMAYQWYQDMLPLALLAVVAFLPRLRNKSLPIWPFMLVVAAYYGVGFAQALTQTPIVSLGEVNSPWHVRIWQFADGSLRAFSLFFSPLQYGQFAAIVAGLAVAWGTATRRWLLPTLIVALSGAAVWTTTNRTALLLLIIVPVTWVLGRTRRRSIVVLTAVSMVTLGALVLTGIIQAEDVLRSSSQARGILNTDSALIRTQDFRVLLSSGLSFSSEVLNGVDMEQLREPVRFRRDNAGFTPVDNSNLYWLLSGGFPLLVLNNLLLVVLTVNLWRWWRWSQNWVYLGGAGLMAATGVAGALNALHQSQYSYLALLLLLATLGLGWPTLSIPTRRRLRLRWR